MTKKKKRNHSPSFKAKVTMVAHLYSAHEDLDFRLLLSPSLW